jgi:DHA1 family bicyclomycin/chloramphenicol resistance-like MFS transporter
MTTKPLVRFFDRTTPPHIATLILIASLQAASLNIFLPSLPSMTAWFDTDYRTLQLSVAVYLGATAVLQLFVGPLSDRYGRRPVLLTSIVIFAFATLACIFAPTAELFLLARIVQAVIVSGMVLARAIVRDMFPQDDAASMIGYVTMGMAVVPMVAPAIGGVLDQWFGWQSSFWFLIAISLFAFWIVAADLGETATNTSAPMMDQVREYPELLSSRRFWGYCLASAFGAGTFFAYLGGAPYVGTNVFDMTPAELGVFFGAPAIGYMVGNGLSGRYSARIGINVMIITGSVLTSLGMATALLLFAFGVTSPWAFFGFATFVGLGNGIILPNATSGMLSVRPHLAGAASGLGGAMMTGGGAALSAIAGWVLTPGSGATPLLMLMFASAFMGLLSILYVIRRERQVTG